MRNIVEDDREVHHVIAGTVTAWRGGLHEAAFSFLADLDRESLMAVYAGLVGMSVELIERLEIAGELDLGELFTDMARAKGIYEPG